MSGQRPNPPRSTAIPPKARQAAASPPAGSTEAQRAGTSPPPRDLPRTSEQGSRFTLRHGIRTMRVYPVNESDVRLLAQNNFVGSLFSSAGGALLGVGINIHVNAAFYEKLAPQAQGMVGAVEPFCFVVGGILMIAWLSYQIANWVTWNGIKQDSSFDTLIHR